MVGAMCAPTITPLPFLVKNPFGGYSAPHPARHSFFSFFPDGLNKTWALNFTFLSTNLATNFAFLRR